jgi:hypothetical protein
MLNEIPFKFTFFYFFSIFFTFALRPRVGPNRHADAGRCSGVRAATKRSKTDAQHVYLGRKVGDVLTNQLVFNRSVSGA